MDDKYVRIEVLKLAAASCRVYDPHDIVRKAETFERYVLGQLEPALEPVVRKPRKRKTATKK